MGLRESRQRVASLLVSAALVLVFAAPVAAAAESTPGITLTAMNPAQSSIGSDLDLTLVAHSERGATTPDRSCRPQDAAMECWGSLMLRLPRYGDIALGDFDVHRVAVGEIACDDEGDDGGGCDHDTVATDVATDAVLAQVNGVASVKWPGNSGLAVGTKVQVKLTLTDNGAMAYADQVDVQLNLFVEGPNKPLLYRSGPQTVRQVSIHVVGGEG